MRKFKVILTCMSVFLAQQAFADMDSSADVAKDKPCGVVAHACMDAGFTRTETAGKQFWLDCMNPVLLGHSVSGVKVEAAKVEACRTDKIAELKKELKELEAVEKK